MGCGEWGYVVGWIHLEESDGGVWLCFCRDAGRRGSGGREPRFQWNFEGLEWLLQFKAFARAGLAEVASGMSGGPWDI